MSVSSTQLSRGFKKNFQYLRILCSSQTLATILQERLFRISSIFCEKNNIKIRIFNQKQPPSSQLKPSLSVAGSTNRNQLMELFKFSNSNYIARETYTTHSIIPSNLQTIYVVHYFQSITYTKNGNKKTAFTEN